MRGSLTESRSWKYWILCFVVCLSFGRDETVLASLLDSGRLRRREYPQWEGVQRGVLRRRLGRGCARLVRGLCRHRSLWFVGVEFSASGLRLLGFVRLNAYAYEFGRFSILRSAYVWNAAAEYSEQHQQQQRGWRHEHKDKCRRKCAFCGPSSI